jgi:hypothetical protein
MQEALDNNLTLILDGNADDLASKPDIKESLKSFGAAHYVRARETGHVLYLEGRPCSSPITSTSPTASKH